MRKTITTCLAAVLLTLPVAASGTGWYFHHSKDGAQMPPPPELAYIEQYDGFYVDKNHASMEDPDKVLYLTFDAGYENGNVGTILDILKEENVPGAFFILEGHLVCNHTASHRDMTKVKSLEEFQGELNRMEQVYRDLTGQEIARYYRPPEGKISEENMRFARECGYSTVFWSFAYADWDNGRQMDPAAAKERILSETHNGEVLLLHPTSATNAAILRDLIREWKQMGFRFGTLDELSKH